MAKADVQFTFDQAVRTMGVTPERLEKLIDEGKVNAVRQGAGLLISRETILEYLAEVSAVKGPKKKAAEAPARREAAPAAKAPEPAPAAAATAEAAPPTETPGAAAPEAGAPAEAAPATAAAALAADSQDA